MDERTAWLTLSLWGSAAGRAVREALAHGVAPQDVVLARVRSSRLAAQLRKCPRVSVPDLLVQLEELGQVAITPADHDWPRDRLAALGDPPPALYVRGTLPLVGPRAVGLVGTRAATPYGTDLARSFAQVLATAGVDVVSGLALGVDGAAHRGALDAEGVTRAVVAGGLEHVYPPEHRALALDVAKRGTLLGEAPPGTRPERWRFVRRNRLVAALCDALVVIEAPLRSGALITARYAVEQGREVFAVPASVHQATSAGCLELLRRGEAALARSAGDVLEGLGWAGPAASDARPLALPDAPVFEDPRHERLYRLLEGIEGATDDELARRTGLPSHEVSALLTGWELEGRVERRPGLGVRRRR
ncbi:MAG: DNA-processing protein DprA [Planctomycetota bacterium]